MIIDFRMLPPAKGLATSSIFPKPEQERTKSFGWYAPLPPSVRKRSLPLLLEEMKECGVTHGVLWGRGVTHKPEEGTTAEDLADVVREHKDVFLTGFAGIGAPAPGGIDIWLKVVDTALTSLALRGIAVNAQMSSPQVRIDDQRYYPIYQRCSELGGILGLTASGGHSLNQNFSMSAPEAVDRVAGDFPRMKIVVSHAFWPWVLEGISVPFRRDNVYLSPDVYGIGSPGYLEWVHAANSFLEDRIVFASTYPGMGTKAAVEGYLRLPFKNDDVREKVMYKNAAKLLGLAA